LEIEWLEDFLCLTDKRNFRQASEKRHISQPAFSRRIRALENWVGAELFDRSAYPIRLTDAGGEFRPVAQHITRLANESRRRMRDGMQERAKAITFACLGTLAAAYVPHWLHRLGEEFDETTYRVLTSFGSAEAYWTSLETGSCDFLICYKDDGDAIDIDHDAFPSLFLDSEVMLPVVSEQFMADEAHENIISKLNPVPYLAYSAHTYLGRIVSDHIRRQYQEVTFDKIYESTLATSLKEMALLGYGVGWLPLSGISENLVDRSLVRAAPAESDIEISIRIFRHARTLGPAAESFWSSLQCK